MSAMKDIKDNLDSILTLGGNSVTGGVSAPPEAVSKYLQKISSLTNPQTELDMKDINLQAAALENDATFRMLKKRSEEKAKYAAVLEQGVRSATASTEVFQSQVEQITQAREQTQKEIKDTQAAAEQMKALFVTRGKQGVTLQREINRLELQIKDLQMTVELTTDKERKAEIMLSESDRKSKEMERELISVRINNSRFLEKNETSQNRLLETEDKLREERDKVTRECNAAKVKVIGLRKSYEERRDEMETTKEELVQLEASLDRLRETMKLELQLEKVAIAELTSRLNGEESANRQLCVELGKKEKSTIRLNTDVKTATQARVMLTAQLEERMALSLELSNRLTELNKHSQLLESRLGDKSIEAESLSKSLEVVQSDVKVLQLQLTKEEHNMLEANRTLKRVQQKVVTYSRDVNEKVDSDQTMTLRVQQIETDAKLLAEELNGVKDTEEQIKTRLAVTEEKKMMLEQQLEDLSLSYKEIGERMVKTTAEHERVEVHLRTKTKQLLKEEHDAKLELNELQNNLRNRTDSVVQLKNGLMLNDVKIRDLTEMLENASVSAEKNRQILSKRSSEISQSNKLLEDEVAQEKTRGTMLEQDLVNVEGRLRSSLAQLKAQETTAEGMAGVNSQDQEMVMARLQEQTQKLERLNAERATVLADTRKWEIKVEDQVQDKNRAMKLLTAEKSVTNKLRDQIEEETDRELEQKSRIKMLEKHNAALDVDLEEKTSTTAKLSIELDDVESEADLMAQEVRSQELKNEELRAIQDGNLKKINALKSGLKTQEQNHLADARAVKMSIVSLQESLMEKIANVELLVRTTQTLKTKTTDLATRLSATESTAATSKTRYEGMLSEDQRLSATVRGINENKLREKALLETSVAQKTDKIKLLEAALVEAMNRGEVLQSDADTKRKESEMMTEQLDQRVAIEQTMGSSIMNKEEDISRLRQSARERGKRTLNMSKEVKAAQFQNRLLKKQLQEKAKAERYLLAELEALRLHVPENKNPASLKSVVAQAKADAALSSVLSKSLRR